jgi:hypothetical protein
MPDLKDIVLFLVGAVAGHYAVAHFRGGTGKSY